MTNTLGPGNLVDLHLPGYSVRGKVVRDDGETVRVRWADGRVTDEHLRDLERVQ